MRIDRILGNRRPVYSFEFFPPKTDDGQRNLEGTLEILKDDTPDYVSVTYGAGGTTRERTVEITKWIKQNLGIEAMAHLSLVGEAEEQASGDPGQAAGRRRGERARPPRQSTPRRDRVDAPVRRPPLLGRADPPGQGALRLLRSEPRASRRSTPRPPDRETDLRYASEKVKAGTGFLITQLFLDNEIYFEFVEAARDAGIGVPITRASCPSPTLSQIKTITGMCGATIPAELEPRELEGRADDPEAVVGAWSRLRDSPMLRSPGARRRLPSTFTR